MRRSKSWQKSRTWLAAGVCLCVGGAARADAPPSKAAPPGLVRGAVYADPKAATEARVADLLARLTQPEKLSLLALEAPDPQRLNTLPVPRLGLPPLWTSDAPNGVRVGQATVFPAEEIMASTWDTVLIGQVGAALGQEARAKNRQVLYGPDLNIHRTPQGGRDFESFSEDPFVTARMGVAYVRGIQSQGVAACLKHYVCNDQESGRHSINVVVDPRALHEIYLAPFKTAVEEGQAWAVMDALNRVNGPWVADNHQLLTDILRNQWRFDGVVISDWGSVHDTVEAAKAGNDIEMPSPQFFSPANLSTALQNRQITQAVIDDKVRRVLRTAVRTGLLDGPRMPDPAQVNSPEHQKLALKVAQEGIVLLKNAGNLLPLDRTKTRSVAVIGPNAAVNQLGGRWSADLTPFYSVSVLDGIKTKAGTKIAVNYVQGTPLTDAVADPVPASAFTPPDTKPGEHGLRAEYFADKDLSGAPTITRLDPQINFNWNDVSPDKSVPRENFSSRWTGFLTPPTTGRYTLVLDSDDGSRLFIDDKLVIDYWSDHGTGSPLRAGLDLVAGHAYKIRVEQYQGTGGAGCSPGWRLSGEGEGVFLEAVAAAKRADVAIVVVGLSNTIEGEELDPPDLLLPGRQNALIQAVAAANKHTIVVMANGTPLLMDKWLGAVPGVIESWYSGEEAGNAVADILFGDVNPSGRLTDTLAARREDYGDWGNSHYYPGVNGTVTYAEGIYVGYRHFDKAKIVPLFPFGFGLSYTTFAFSGLHVSPVMKRDGATSVRVVVQNTGKRAGAEVVQLYVRDLAPKVDRPVRELKGFARVTLSPGEKKTVTFSIDESALSYYNVAMHRWKANAGRYAVEIGASSRDIRATSMLRLQ